MSESAEQMHSLYAAWLALGAWIGRHLMIIVPAGVAVGIAFPELLLPVKPFVPTLFAIMTLQNSLRNDLGAMRHALRRPLVLITVLAMVHLIMPLVTFALASLIFGPNSPTVAGVVLEYSVPIGASTVMWVGMFSGEIPLCLSCLLISTLISPFTIPATLQLLVGTTVEVDALGMMGNMAYMIAFPALIATALNEFSGGRVAKTVAPATTPISRLVLPLIVSTNATALASYARNPEPRLFAIMAVMLVFAVASFLVGMFVASRLSDNKASFVAMSFSCGIRNVTAGAVLATQYFGPEVMFPAIIGTPFQQLLAALFGRIMERRLKKRYPTEDISRDT